MIFGEVAVHEVPVARIELQRFGQCRADAPGDTADTLGSGGLVVEHAAEAESAEHPVDAGFAGEAVHADLGEERPEARCGEIRGDIAGFVVPFACHVLTVQKLAQGLSGLRPAVRQVELVFGDARPPGQFLAQRGAGDVDCGADRSRAPAAARTGPSGVARVAQVDQHLAGIEAEHFPGDLRQDRVGTGADIGHVGFDQRRAIRFERDARPCFADVVHPCRAGHAGADPPFALARVARFARAVVPSESLGALAQALGELVGGEGQAFFGIVFRDIAQAQLDRVDPDLVCKHIHRPFERGHAHRLARRAHRSGGHPVDARELEHQLAVLPRVEEVRGLQHRLRKGLARQVGDQRFVPEAGQPAILVCGQPDALGGFGPAHDALEHLLARQYDPHRTAKLHCGKRGGNHVFADAQLRSEPATHEARDQANLAFVQPHCIGELGDIVVQHLQRGMDRQAFSIPLRDRGMRLHRCRGVPLGREGDVHAVRGLRHSMRQIALMDGLALLLFGFDRVG